MTYSINSVYKYIPINSQLGLMALGMLASCVPLPEDQGNKEIVECTNDELGYISDAKQWISNHPNNIQKHFETIDWKADSWDASINTATIINLIPFTDFYCGIFDDISTAGEFTNDNDVILGVNNFDYHDLFSDREYAWISQYQHQDLPALVDNVANICLADYPKPPQGIEDPVIQETCDKIFVPDNNDSTNNYYEISNYFDHKNLYDDGEYISPEYLVAYNWVYGNAIYYCYFFCSQRMYLAHELGHEAGGYTPVQHNSILYTTDDDGNPIDEVYGISYAVYQASKNIYLSDLIEYKENITI